MPIPAIIIKVIIIIFVNLQRVLDLPTPDRGSRLTFLVWAVCDKCPHWPESRAMQIKLSKTVIRRFPDAKDIHHAGLNIIYFLDLNFPGVVVVGCRASRIYLTDSFLDSNKIFQCPIIWVKLLLNDDGNMKNNLVYFLSVLLLAIKYLWILLLHRYSH